MSAVLSRCRRLGLVFVTAGLLLAPLGTTAAGAVECHPEPPTNQGGHWSWRTIDGKRCWYPGQPGMAKANLRWTQSSPPTLARGGDEPPAARTAANRDARMQQLAPVGSDAALLESYWPSPEPAPFNERWPQ